MKQKTKTKKRAANKKESNTKPDIIEDELQEEVAEKTTPVSAENLEENDLKTEVPEAVDPFEKLQNEYGVLNDKFLRLLAEFDNYKRRTAKEFGLSRNRGIENAVKSLLPVLDDIDRTLGQEKDKLNLESLLDSTKMVAGKFTQELEKLGVKVFTSVGEKFDPEKHDALTTMSNTDKEDDVILEEYLKGYELAGRVIRHSQVIVNKV
jgi:molecular chaperone GrpE